MISPCYNCEYRRPATETTPSCHSYCEAYKNFDRLCKAANAEKLHTQTVGGVERMKRMKRQAVRDYEKRREGRIRREYPQKPTSGLIEEE